ncbi:MAG: DUF6390 family protein [Geodermatophilaceae bacterium]
MPSGAGMFVRYAFPPNERGYCGPSDTGSLLQYGGADAAEAEFRPVAQAFTGAWPYLVLIAAAAGIPDPLDARVVEAYWVGNDLLDQVSPTVLGTSMEELFRRSVGQFSKLALGFVTNGLAHHSFHVFCIYPWVGLLGNERMHAHALNVLDKCRIREARVVEIADGRVTVESQPLIHEDGRLALGPAVREATNGAVTNGVVDGLGLADGLAVGDWVAVHWDWICDRLTEGQRDALGRYTTHHLTIVNDRAG